MWPATGARASDNTAPVGCRYARDDRDRGITPTRSSTRCSRPRARPGRGFEPDVVVETTAAAIAAHRDPVGEAALDRAAVWKRPRVLAALDRRRHSSDVQSTWLERFVEDVRVVVPVPGMPHEIERLPDGRTSFVVRTLDDGTGDAWVMGPRTHALFKTATGVARAVIVELRPGWALPVLGVPASELVDRHVTLAELWGASGAALCDELVAMREPVEVRHRLEHVFAARLEREGLSSATLLSRRAVQLLAGVDARVDAVAAQLGVTARHLRRVFGEHVGIGPKDFIRCMRLHRAVTGTGDWGRIAVDAGYYDQAHLIADFHDLVGLTPSAYAKRAIAHRVCH